MAFTWVTVPSSSKGAASPGNSGRRLPCSRSSRIPRQVLAAPEEPFRLTPFRLKARRLADLGIEILYVARFDRAFAAREPASFVADVVAAGIGARHVVVGHDFAFGRKRAGNVALLSEIGASLRVGVTSIAAAGTGATIHSASRARRLLAAGEVASLPAVLGRYWEIDGHVITGDRRGRTIGFPTANVRTAGILHPARGVYALWAQPGGDAADGPWYPAVANLGRRPTFDKTEDLLEVHIFDYAGDLYGKRLRAAFADRVRPERRFDGIEALKAQIAIDCDTARAILARLPAPDAEQADTMPLRQVRS